MNVRLVKKQKYSVTLRAGSTIHPLEKPTNCVMIDLNQYLGLGMKEIKHQGNTFLLVLVEMLDCWTWDGQGQELRSKDFILGEL